MARPLTGALLDTSVLISPSSATGLPPSAQAAISVVSVGELHAGVRLARDPGARTLRQARLRAIRGAYAALAVDDTVAERYGDALEAARAAGRTTKATDLLILATAWAAGRTLYTLDHRQAALGRALGLAVVSPAAPLPSG